MKPRVLVTGGAGFIGSEFVRRYCREFHFTVVDLLTYAGSVENLDGAATHIRHGDVRDYQLMDELVAQADYVVHFAAETHVTRSIAVNRHFFDTDVMGTHALVSACLKHRGSLKRLVHISTSEVYGSARDGAPMFEDHPLEPMSPYAAAKCGADRLVQSFWHTYKLPVVILRPFNNYGQRQHIEKLIPRFITNTILGSAMTVHGNGEAARDFVHVSDTARAVWAVLQADDHLVHGEVFNVASGEARSVRSIAEDIREIMNQTTSVVHVPDRPGQVGRHCGGFLKIQNALGWTPSVDWKFGLRDTVNWYKRNSETWMRQIWAREQELVLHDGTEVAQ